MKRSPAFVCHRLLCSTVVALLVAGCGDGVVSLRDSLATVRVDSVTTPAGNVLVRRVFATLTRADSAWVEVTGSADPLQRTPSIRPVDGTNEFLVAGLRQAESYSIRVVSRSRAGARLESGAISTATDSLPVPLRTVRYTVTGAPSTGYTLFPINVSGRGYIVAFDAAGTVRWYFDADAAIPTAPVAAITQLRTGGFLAYVGFTSGWQPVAGRYFRIGLDGAVVSGISAPTPFYTDSHEIIPLYTGDSLSGSILFGYDLRTTDMTAFGGPSNTLLAGHYIFRQSLSGATDFWWNSWDHLRIDGWIEEPAIMRTWPQIDYAHPNAMAVDHDGNYLVSWRHLAEITKITRGRVPSCGAGADATIRSRWWVIHSASSADSTRSRSSRTATTFCSITVCGTRLRSHAPSSIGSIRSRAPRRSSGSSGTRPFSIPNSRDRCSASRTAIR